MEHSLSLHCGIQHAAQASNPGKLAAAGRLDLSQVVSSNEDAVWKTNA